MGNDVKEFFDLDEAIGFTIERTQQTLKRGLREQFQKNNLSMTPYQWIILYRLWDNDGLKQTELADLTLKDRASITRIIDVMERKNLVMRKNHEHDRRVLQVYLTEKGYRLKESLPKIAADFTCKITEGISKKDLEKTIEVLRLIEKNAEKISKKN